MKYEDLTYEEKQAALAEANEMMKSDKVKLADIKGYVESCRLKFTTPYLAEEELDWLILQAEHAQVLGAWEETARSFFEENIKLKHENKRLRDSLELGKEND